MNTPSDTILVGGILINIYETLKQAEAMGFTVDETRVWLETKQLPPELIRNLVTHYILFYANNNKPQ